MNEHDDEILGGDIEDALPEEELEDEELAEGDDAALDPAGKKKKDLIDEDTVSLDDEADDELEDEEEPYDDITNY